MVEAQESKERFAVSALMTPADVARELGCTPRHVLNLLDRGGLPFVNIGLTAKRVPRIPRADFAKWRRDRTRKALNV